LILTAFLIGGKAEAKSFIFGSQLNNFYPVKTEVFNRDDYESEEVIVKFKQDVSNADIEMISDFYQTEILEKNKTGFYKMGISQTSSISSFIRRRTAPFLIQNLLQDPRIEYAEPNYIAKAQLIPNDPYYKYQWNFKNINLENAWDVSQGVGAVVAIVDTGVAYENYGNYKQAPDLAGTSFTNGYDFVENDNHPNDENGHGTHLAGTIAQTTDNNKGAAGIAPKASIMPIKVLDKNGRGNYFDVAQGIIWAADNGANIINLSLGGSSSSRYLKDACAYAYSKGVTIIAAAGNDNRRRVIYPARYNDYVIAVGAVRFDGTKSYYSNTGSSLDIMAPGGDLRVDQNNDGYADGILQQTLENGRQKFGYYFFQGTSMACAHISGAAALLTSQGINTPQKIREALEKTAEDKGSFGWDKKYGWGIVDIFQALSYNNQNVPLEEEPEEPSEEPEEEQPEQTIDQMEAKAFIIDRRKNSKTNFNSRERVYGLVNVEFEGEPINNAKIKFQIKNENGEIIKERNDETNSKGECKEYLGRFREKGDYTVLIEVKKEGYETFGLKIGFKIE
jgi:serine protease